MCMRSQICKKKGLVYYPFPTLGPPDAPHQRNRCLDSSKLCLKKEKAESQNASREMPSGVRKAQDGIIRNKKKEKRGQNKEMIKASEEIL